MTLNQRSALLTAIMITSLTTVIAGAVQRFSPGWRPEPLIVVCLLAAIESGFVHYVARRERMSLGELARYLAPELFTLAVLMRIAASLSFATATFAADAERWLYDPLSIFEPLFVLYILVGLAAAGLTHLSMRDLSELAPRPFESPETLSESGRRYASQLAEERSAAIQRIGQRFVMGGALCMLALGLEAVNLRQPGGPSEPISALTTAAVLTYLVAGFLLYSQARLALLRARWQQEGARVADAVGRRWSRMSWLVILGIVVGAALLPRTYGRGLLETLGAGLALIGYFFATIGYLVVWLFGMLVALPAWLLSLLMPTGGGVTAPPPPPPVIPPLPPEVEREPQLLPALIFWLCMLLLAGYAIQIVLRRHPGLLRGLLTFTLLARLSAWLAALWGDASSWTAQAVEAAREALRPRPASPRPRGGPRLPRLGSLAPRELVRYFYRSTLHRAAEGGAGRRPGQTPYEYAATLTARVPDAEQDIADLTDSFVAAQYDTRPVEPEAARRVRGPWSRLRRALRSVRDQRQGPASTPPTQL